MNLIAAINAFNASSQPQIELLNSRDGRVRARLPRVDREILVGESQLNPSAKVSATDIAWLCEEARRATLPGHALLGAALESLTPIETPAAKR
jgi:hypothetical protein